MWATAVGNYRPLNKDINSKTIFAEQTIVPARVSGFPVYRFGQPGSAENTSYKHLSRARRDVQDLLKAVISRDELLP